VSGSVFATRPLAPLSLLDLRDADPYPAYEQMRAAGNVLWDEGMRAWLVLDHEGCAFVERNESLYEEPTGTLPDAHEIVGPRNLRALVGVEHDVLHRFLAHRWRPGPVAPYGAALVRPVVAARLAGLAPRPELELFGDLAAIVPIAVVARLLGLSHDDEGTLREAKRWLEAVLAWRHTFGEDAEVREEAVAASRRLEPILLDVVRDRRDRPRDDVISALWAVGRDVAPDWSERDVLDNATFLFEAGSETTSLLICTATHLLLALPAGERTATLAEPGAFGRFLEEVLRHTTVVHVRARRATRDLELGGAGIAAGERVLVVNAAANRDPARWPDAATFDPGRSRLASHLAFNVGPRHCAGAHLARMQATETILALFRAFPDLAPDPDAPLPVFRGFVSRAFRPLHLRHVPTSPAAAREAVLR
jgi:cytochrome P450